MNPDFWDHGMNQDVFQGWMQMAEVSVLFIMFMFLGIDLISYSSGFKSVDDHFHLWKEIHKDMAHQLNELQKVEQQLQGLLIQMEGVEVWVVEQGVLGDWMGRLVLWCIRALHHQMAKTDFLQHLVSSFLQFGGQGDEGPGSSGGPPEPPRGFGLGSPPSSCPSLKSLRSSNLDSPLITTPATSFRASPPGPFSEREEDWLRSALQALPSPGSSDGPDI